LGVNTGMLVASKVLDLPILAPKNWETWWEFWIANAKPIRRARANHNGPATMQTSWLGFNAFYSPHLDVSRMSYPSQYVNCSSVFPELYDFIPLLPMQCYEARIGMSAKAFGPHTDDVTGMQIRTLLYDENSEPTFFYFHNDQKKYQTLPKTSNTWIYKDSEIKHGSDFSNKRKILIMFSGKIDQEKVDDIFLDPKYDEYSVKF
jgi:hypothetical protein